MHKLTFTLLWLLVFSLPWELLISFSLIGTMSRVIGVAAVAAGALTLATQGRMRRPRSIVYVALVFTLLNLVSIFWSVRYTATIERVTTYAQLLGLVWLVWEFARSDEEQRSLLLAYCLGAYVSVAELLRSFIAGEQQLGFRRTASAFDPNDLGLTLAIGIPMAWYLFLNRRGIVRIAGAVYLPLAVVAILLTASRGAFLAGMVALSIVPLTLPRQSFRTVAQVAVLVLLTAGAAALMVPESSWDRVMTTRQELSGGTMSGRVNIWSAGWEAFKIRPLFGSGAGAFEAAVEPLIGPNNAPHNVFLAILVELGIVGFLVFTALLAVCGGGVYRLRSPERAVWVVVVFIWMVGAMSLGWHYRKVTWFLVGMIAVQSSIARIRRQRAEARQAVAETPRLALVGLRRGRGSAA